MIAASFAPTRAVHDPSERQLAAYIEYSLPHRWFVVLDIGDRV
ncbi:hypothetical protein R2Q26_02000 [Nitrosomonas sp. Is37]|nr:hypothetical protein [Nitrosomonas sp. Is37]